MSAHLINRRFMPQIDEKDLIPLLCYLAGIGIRSSINTRDPQSLTGHQAVVEEKVEGIMKNQEALSKPLLIAAHGFVLDGNHRAEAHKRLKTEKVAVIILPLAYEDALLALAEAPESYSYGDGNFHPVVN